MRDPFTVLGVGRDASIAELRAARKRLAREMHPDVGGDERAMQEVNAAFEAAVAHATGRRPIGEPPRTPGGRRRRADTFGTQVDEWSFVVEALPVDAFEALVIVAGWMGQVLVDDPPYLLDVHLDEPTDCWCRLTLVPDAGSSTVSLTVAPAGSGPAPDVETVRDLWIAQLNSLGRWTPGG